MTINYKQHVVTATLVDLLLIRGFLGITETDLLKALNDWSGAFVNYCAREAGKIWCYTYAPSNHKTSCVFTANAFAGVQKYWNKDGDALVGAYNNGAYGLSGEIASDSFNNGLAPILVEGAEPIVHAMEDYALGRESNISVANITNDTGQSLVIGAAVAGIIPFIGPITEAVDDAYLNGVAALLFGVAAVSETYHLANDIYSYASADNGTLVNSTIADMDNTTKTEL